MAPDRIGYATRGLALALSLSAVGLAFAAKEADVRSTRHNFSADSSNATRASGGTATIPGVGTRPVNTSEVCVYCHTPHAASSADAANRVISPLWNRRVATQTYTPYTSSTLDAQALGGYTGEPQGSSKLCLSCHDGMLALGNVAVISGYRADLSGSGGADTGISIPFQNTDAGGTIPSGVAGANSGFTRRLGTDLRNDHPISVTYDTALAVADGEMRAENADASGTVVIEGSNLSVGWSRATYDRAVARRASGFRPLMPLEATGSSGKGQVQCGTCHDPHLNDPTVTESLKFLRGSRLQKVTPSGGGYDQANDILCLACHEKAGAVWSTSAHATSVDADEVYKRDTSGATGTYNAAGQRDLSTTQDTAVWQYACLNCHDTHTVPGARRLLREGVDGATTVNSDTGGQGTFRYKTGGQPAVEETCFQCHRPRTDADNVLNLASQSVPDIKSEFESYSAMPIRASSQCAGSETHSIGDVTVAGTAAAGAGKDFVESAANLGYKIGSQNCDSGSTRHVECTDCHNPHRLQKGNHAGSNGGTDIRGTASGNAVSGVLRGSVGVEPVYPAETPGSASSTRFGTLPISFDLKCGSGVGSRFAGCNGDVQYEYQICLKCHSNYAYSDVSDPVDGVNGGQYNHSGRPQMGRGSTTPANLVQFTGSNGSNLFPDNVGTRYTNQAMEFWGPVLHRGEANGSAPEPNHGQTDRYASPNHRSWHPVMAPTGRTKSERGSTAVDNFRSEWTGNVGTQTMYCSDCHGRDTTTALNCADTNQVPYVSTNSCTTGSGPRHAWGPHGSANPFILKGKYDRTDNSLCDKCHNAWNANRSGFCCEKSNNLHAYHRSKMSNIRCTNCHIAVPHGWKNKALLVNVYAVGNEVGLSSDQSVSAPNAVGYTQGPYYLNAMLKVDTWQRSGQWHRDGDCQGGGVGEMKSTCQND